jgi:RNA polymerase subunit RPABC4/transcription elongation factor Spt4
MSDSINNQPAKQVDEVFCHSCGAIIKKEAEICPKCGVRQNPSGKSSDVSQNWLTCLLLCIFLGVVGGHRFYTKKIGTAILMIVTAGGCGIWTIIDLVMIITGKFKDADGNFITKDA